MIHGRRARRRAVWALLAGMALAGEGCAAVPGSADSRSDAALSGERPLSPPRPRVLVLFSGDRLSAANILFDEAFRHALIPAPRGPVECSGEFLDEVSFPANVQERMRDLLREKYGGRPPDAVVTFGAPSLDVYLRSRADLFPEVPIVFAGLFTDTLMDMEGAHVTGVLSSRDAPGTVRMALRLHPRTRQVFVLTGKIRFWAPDSFWTRYRNGRTDVSFQGLGGLLDADLLRAVSSLPGNSLVFYQGGPGNGVRPWALPDELLGRVAAASNAPIYGVSDPLVGSGFVGAITTPIDSIGRATAILVGKVLSRSDADALPVVQRLPATPLFDWRELKRWHVHKNLLPAGSVVRYEARSFWRQYWLLVTTWGGLFLLQSGLILALVLQSRRRRRAELEARRRREELAHMTRVATMGELTASLAHEINQPLAAILSNAQAGARLLSTGEDHLQEIREILADIAADDMRAGEVIRRMRALLRKGEFHPTELYLNDLIEEVVGILRGELILQNVSLTLDLSPRVPPVHGDRVQLQQVFLNLMMNALDAMKEVPDGGRRVLVRAVPSVANTVEVSVEDTGAGIPPDKLEQCFEPFVTTKAHGMGLGLSICRSIIQAHGGRIGSRNNPGRGATFWFTLPAAEERKP